MEPVSTAGASREFCVPLLQQRGPAAGKGTGGKHSTPGWYWSRGSPRKQSALLLRAWPPGPSDPGGPALTCSLLMAARTCGPRRAGRDRCCGTQDPETKVVRPWTARSVSALSELRALASLVHSLLSNKLADPTSGHLHLRNQAQNFLRGRAGWLSGASVLPTQPHPPCGGWQATVNERRPFDDQVGPQITASFTESAWAWSSALSLHSAVSADFIANVGK